MEILNVRQDMDEQFEEDYHDTSATSNACIANLYEEPADVDGSFGECRLNQWSWVLDAGSLINLQLLAILLALQPHHPSESGLR